MSTLAERVASLANTDLLPELKIALVSQAVTKIAEPIPAANDPGFKAANASHQLALAVIADPDTYVTRVWLVIVSSDDPLISADPVTDGVVIAAVVDAWPSLTG